MSYKIIKRVMDISISIIGILLTSPIMLITAIAIKIESEGPIVFQQERLGYKGKVFKIYKFRSMCIDAEKGGVYEKKGDHRVTKVGKVIRKTSIDELPQFLNVLKGEMSLIGPRPALTYHPWKYNEYTSEQKMFDVKPGVTGWAQVNGRKNVEWPMRILLNVEYVDRMSFYFDVKIACKTISSVFFMKDNLNELETATKR